MPRVSLARIIKQSFDLRLQVHGLSEIHPSDLPEDVVRKAAEDRKDPALHKYKVDSTELRDV